MHSLESQVIVGITIGTGQALGNHWERVTHMFGHTGTAVVQTFDPFKCLGCIVAGRLVDNAGQSKTQLLLYLAVAMAVSQLIFAISSVDEGSTCVCVSVCILASCRILS